MPDLDAREPIRRSAQSDADGLSLPAGETCGRCAIAILLCHGIKAAVDFVVDLEHHES